MTSDSKKAKLLLSIARESDMSIRDIISLAKKANKVPGVEPKEIVSTAVSDGASNGKEKLTEKVINFGVTISDKLETEVSDLEDELNIDELEEEQDSKTGLHDVLDSDEKDAHEVVSNFDPEKFEQDLDDYSLDSVKETDK